MMLQMTNDPGLLDELPGEAIQKLQQQARQMPLSTTLYAIKRFSEAATELKGGYQPQLPLELALIEAVQGGPVAPVIVQQVVQQVAQEPAQPGHADKEGGKNPSRQPTGARSSTDAVAPATSKAEPAVLDAEAARRLHARWKEFLALVKTQCGQQVAAALAAVRDIAVTEQAVALAFGNNEFSRNMVAKAENLPGVTTMLSTFMGRNVTLECQIGDKANLAGRVVGVAAAPVSGPDPLLEFAVKDLGAKVLGE